MNDDQYRAADLERLVDELRGHNARLKELWYNAEQNAVRWQAVAQCRLGLPYRLHWCLKHEANPPTET